MSEPPLLVHGTSPLPARLEVWQAALRDDAALVHGLLAEHGSPVNLIDPEPLRRNAKRLTDAAADAGVEARIFFARKANKALALVDAALQAGHGVDVSSEHELLQVLERGARPDRVILTAAVKPAGLLRLALRHGVMISVDNEDELELLVREAAAMAATPRIAVRLAPDVTGLAPTRFGLPRATWTTVAGRLGTSVSIVGVHFHLHGYEAKHRSRALHQALDLLESLREHGHEPEFVDIGGGVPMRYTESSDDWHRLLADLEADPARHLWRGRALRAFYPLWQDPVGGDWLRAVLEGEAVGERVRALGVRVHLEPGRALLDGCGLTLARVEFRKQLGDGTRIVGLAMNRTQLRSAVDDFLLDPLLVPAARRHPGPATEAFVVGAYCIEDELITRRRLVFAQGAAVGDALVFVNTAGYLMHILESASHQIPLARNLVRSPAGWVVDAIDDWSPSALDGREMDLPHHLE